jgi:hypothetical protein
MSVFDNQIICKTVGGLDFLSVKRPDSLTGKCPGTTVPCSSKTSLENTVCYEPNEIADNICPIVDIKIIDPGALDYLDYIDNPDWVVFTGLLESALVYTKTATDSLPITNTQIANRLCMNPKEYMTNQNDFFYPSENQQVSGCTLEKNNHELYDPRFRAAG